ncbi:hypothetical protein K523DRAFT_94540 [Schizophyllum commune Tattone D]|nr:hypothetical protein K523DRAFT_94540 [Schizophyllum commune Tattone D]
MDHAIDASPWSHNCMQVVLCGRPFWLLPSSACSHSSMTCLHWSMACLKLTGSVIRLAHNMMSGRGLLWSKKSASIVRMGSSPNR